MLLPFCRDWRTLRRSQGTRLYCDEAACGRFGTERHALLVGAARRQREFERRSNALATGERSLAAQSARSTGPGSAGMGCRAVSGTRCAAGPLEPRA